MEGGERERVRREEKEGGEGGKRRREDRRKRRKGEGGEREGKVLTVVTKVYHTPI